MITLRPVPTLPATPVALSPFCTLIHLHTPAHLHAHAHTYPPATAVALQDPRMQRLFIPVGGGGLAAGCAVYIKQLRPDIEVRLQPGSLDGQV